jgi:hypothetical protein
MSTDRTDWAPILVPALLTAILGLLGYLTIAVSNLQRGLDVCIEEYKIDRETLTTNTSDIKDLGIRASADETRLTVLEFRTGIHARVDSKSNR